MEKSSKVRKVLIRIGKIFGWIIFSIVCLLLLISLAIQVPYVQNKIVQKAVAFLHDKIKTEVRLEHISIRFPKKVVLKGIYIEDQAGDTLLYVQELGVDIDMWGLTDHRIQLNEIQLQTCTTLINRPKGHTDFNYTYIVNAFSDTTAVQDTTAQPWDFSIGEVVLEKTRLSFLDYADGNLFAVNLGELRVTTDEFDLAKSIIHIDEIALSNAKARIELAGGQPEEKKEQDTLSSQPSPFDLMVKEISLDKVDLTYENRLAGQSVQVNLQQASVTVNDFDLNKQLLALNEVSLRQTFVAYHQHPVEKPAVQPKSEQATQDSSSWKISLNELSLVEDIFQYYDFSQPQQERGMDFNRLWLSQVSTTIEDFSMDGMNIKGVIESLSLQEKSGFEVRSVKGSFATTDNGLSLKDFTCTTGSSAIALNTEASFTSWKTLTSPETRVNLAMERSQLSVRDILFFSPTLLDSLPVNISPQEKITVETTCSGTVGDVSISKLDIRTLQNTILQVTGKAKGLPNMDKANFDIDLKQFRTVRQDVQGVLKKGTIPSTIQVPEWLQLTGTFHGTMKTPDVKALFTSDVGSINADVSMDLRSSKRPAYNGNVQVKELNAGSLLRQPTMGKATLEASVKGTGFDKDNLHAAVNAVVHQFTYNNYTYKNLVVDGTLKNYFFSGKAFMRDKNLDFMLTADLDYNENVAGYKLNLDLKNADFQALQLAERPLRARGSFVMDVTTPDFRKINGNVAIRKVALFNGESLYAVDSLLVASIDQEGVNEITLSSDIIAGNFEGTIDLIDLPAVIQNHLNRYFCSAEPCTPSTNNAKEQQDFKFELVLKNTDLLTEVLLPDLEPFVPGTITGEFNSAESILKLRFSLAQFRYAAVGMDSILMKVDSDKKSLDYSLRLRKIKADTLRMESLVVSGTVANDSIYSRLIILDSLQKEKYKLGGVVHREENLMRFRLLSDALLLNYKKWNAPKDNYLDLIKGGWLPHNFEITHEQSRLALLKKSSQDSTISVAFQKIYLEDLTSFMEGSAPVMGTVDGDIHLAVSSSRAFQSQLKVQDLTLFKQQWGDLSLQVSNTANGPYTLDATLEGSHVKMNVAGTYHARKAEPTLAFKTTISKLDLRLAEPFTMGQLKNMKGELTGDVSIEGKASDPQIDGALTFHDASFLSTFVNSTFTLKNETVRVQKTGLIFRDFKIYDPGNHVAEINGSIRRKSLAEFDLNLTFFTKDFQVLNSTADDNELFYGKVSISTTAKIEGTSSLPKIEMTVSLDNKSDFTYVVPQSERGLLEQKGIVLFIDKDAKKDPFLASINPNDTVKSTFRGIDLTANIELTDQETFNIVIDPVTGDKLSVKGNSTLTLDIDPTGDMQLSGRYEVSSGTYNLSFYKLVKRTFSIEKGGSITWSGDPMNANLDLSAVYEVETSPMELVSNQLTTTDPQQINMYKQRLPFLVYLNIRGELLTPEISFKLDMPESKQNALGGGVYARIQDINTRESDLNKQVFALLVLKRFIADDPFDSQSGSDVAATARRSVSKLLTEQLNRLSENIKGVQLSFDLKSYEDYSTGQAQGQTELQLGVTKNLFHDRLVVKVSGNLDLEGQTSQQNSMSDYIGDLALEYKITEDGRLRITGFRNSDYDMIDGELTETGAGLIYIKDYNAFRELFRANDKAD